MRLDNYDIIKDRIKLAVINYAANADNLKNRPHKRFLDLAAVPYLAINEIKTGKVNIPVTDRLMGWWNIGKEELFRQGYENLLRHDTPCFIHVEDMIWKLLREYPDEDLLGKYEAANFGMPRLPMYVVTNPGRCHGACCMLNKPALQKFADKNNADLIIYPSSTEEIIILLDKGNMKNSLRVSDIMCINERSVAKEERLSNSIYRYDRHTGEVSVYQEGEPLSP